MPVFISAFCSNLLLLQYSLRVVVYLYSTLTHILVPGTTVIIVYHESIAEDHESIAEDHESIAEDHESIAEDQHSVQVVLRIASCNSCDPPYRGIR